ncbi:alpha/beta fold hydrolase [Kitasatospora kifunensis]|uniref:Pimeloyl-ACP methyl ester carboxylesterase n=1 Tax=Kitasatospora kifunensis TaxID=58351 RepID=A0A7W7VYZ7_KITKI|nr:alpha/beta hydrolase [Kitasatospora kifunensis]MBB4927224.1 pimeloyl-ACP methyl ester carboxylesterase [Kitasatospora kifunensis]
MAAIDLTRFLAAYDALLERRPGSASRLEQLDLTSEYGTTRVIACGPADGEPLVLLHGGGATAAAWFANLADLSGSRRVYAVDRIGEAGRSRCGERPIQSVADLFDWLDGVLDGLALDRTDLCGHSYGAWLALSYALRAPRRIRRLVLLDPTQCFAGYRPGYLFRALPMLIRPTAQRARAFLAWESGGKIGGAQLDPGYLDLYGLAAEFPRRKVVVGKRPTAQQLRKSGLPTLVVLAGASRAHDIRRVETAARRHLPHVETLVLPGVSHHAMPTTRAAELDAAILDFLGKP